MNIEELVRRQREFFNTGKTIDISYRKQALLKLYEALKTWEDRLNAALNVVDAVNTVSAVVYTFIGIKNLQQRYTPSVSGKAVAYSACACRANIALFGFSLYTA